MSAPNGSFEASALKALADPARVSIMRFLLAPGQRHASSCCAPENCACDCEPVCACDIEGFLGLSQSTVSYHMSQLVNAGLVTAGRYGRYTHYQLNPVAFAALIEFLKPFASAVPLPIADAVPG